MRNLRDPSATASIPSGKTVRASAIPASVTGSDFGTSFGMLFPDVTVFYFICSCSLLSLVCPLVSGPIVYYRGLSVSEPWKSQLQNLRTIKLLSGISTDGLLSTTPAWCSKGTGRGISSPLSGMPRFLATRICSAARLMATSSAETCSLQAWALYHPLAVNLCRGMETEATIPRARCPPAGRSDSRSRTNPEHRRRPAQPSAGNPLSATTVILTQPGGYPLISQILSALARRPQTCLRRRARPLKNQQATRLQHQAL